MTAVKLTGNFLATARCLIFDDGGGISWAFNSLTNTLTASASAGGTFLSSVGLTDASTSPIYAITNSPLTANGTLDITLNVQTKNTIFSGPSTGANAQPTFRALVAADIPTIPYTNVSGLATVAHSGVYSDLSGIPSIPGGANPSVSIGLSATNGSASTWMRSDAAPGLDQTIAPTWSGAHNWTSTLAASANPLTAATTRAVTGLATFKAALSTANSNALASDAALTLTFNETGWYAIEIFLPFFEATSGAGGFQWNFLNGGSYSLANLRYQFSGFSNGAVALATAQTSPGVANGFATISTSSSAPSWVLAKGVMQVTGTGTAAIQWAQNSTLAIDPTTLMAGAYVIATKIG